MIGARIGRSAFAAALLLGIGLSRGASAQEASPVAGPQLPPPPPNCSVVADGLIAPRSIAIAGDGTLYITETGTGGDEVLSIAHPGSEEEGTPVGAEEVPAATPVRDEEAAPPSTRGYTGQVTVVTPDGTQSVLTAGLPSYSDGVGPEGIVLGPDGKLYVAVGGVAVGAGIPPLPEENTVYQIDPLTGTAAIIAELGPFEELNNPDGTDVNPNLYGITVGSDGQLYVADAGGNTIYKVDPTTGDFTLVAVVPGPPTGAERQPVPTRVEFGPDGALQVSLLSEDWPADAASVLKLESNGSFTGLVNGLSGVVGLAIGPDGATYVSQLTTDFASEGAPGNVLRINADGTTEVVVDGLVLPNGIAFDSAGNLYVAVVSIDIGAPGQVLRCDVGAGGSLASPVASSGSVASGSLRNG